MCSLGINFQNSNVASEVAQLLISNQDKYVPVMNTKNEKIILDTIRLHGINCSKKDAETLNGLFRMENARTTDYKAFEPNLQTGMRS